MSAQPRENERGGNYGRSVRRRLEPYRRIFAPPLRGAAVFAILMIGLIPLNGIGQSVLGPYVLHEFGHLSEVGAVLGGAVIWVGAIVGSLLAFRVLDRIGRIRSVIWARSGLSLVYVPMATVAANTVALVPLYCLLGVVTWFGASACWPLPSECCPPWSAGALRAWAAAFSASASASMC